MHFQWVLDLVLNWRFFFPRMWCKFGWGEAGVEIHAEFMLISFLPWIFTTLCATFCITMVLSSCWIHAEFQAKPWKVPKFANKVDYIQSAISEKHCQNCKNRIFLTFNGLAWIQHEFNMNSTPLLCKVLHKALWRFKVKMNSAWIRHEFNTNLISIIVQSIVQLRLKMKSASNQHDFSMNSAWIQHQSDFTKRFWWW